MHLEGQVVQVNLDDIIPNRFQPRIAFDEKALNELAASIREHGIIQPLVLRKLGKKYEIIAGERRYKASQLAGLTTVPAVISNIDDNSSAEVALVENIQRRDLTPIEEARSYKNLLDKGYLTQEQLAKKMGLSQSAISNKLRLLNLDNKVQQALLDGKISERHARALLSLNSKEDQVEWLNKIINERITVRDLDKKLKEYLGESTSSNDIPLVDLTPNIEEIKETAIDINNNKPKNIANLLVSEDNMTEFSESLPTNEVKPEILETNVDDPFAQILNGTSKTEEENVNNNSSRFFNQLEESPATLDNLYPFSNEGVFNVADENKKEENKTDSDIEIFDFAAPTPIKEEVKEEKPVEEEKTSSIMDELNPNNKFFQPLPEQQKETTPLIEEQDFLINPMDFVDDMDGSKGVKESRLPDSINQVRDFINKLKGQGIKINIEEADLDSSYQFTIQIEK